MAAFSDCPAGNGSGDRITLRAGTYTLPSQLTITRSVVIASVTAGLQVAIRSNTTAQELIMSTNSLRAVNLQLEDLDIRGTGAGTFQIGVAMFGGVNEKLTVRRCKISNFYRGLYVDGVDLDVIETRIMDNNCGGEGGGIKHSGEAGTSLNIRSSQISGNSAVEDGGGIHFNGGGTSSIVNSTISGNHAMHGGGMNISPPAGTVFNITASTIAFNTADDYAGGVENWSGFTTNVSESIVANNDAPQATPRRRGSTSVPSSSIPGCRRSC